MRRGDRGPSAPASILLSGGSYVVAKQRQQAIRQGDLPAGVVVPADIFGIRDSILPGAQHVAQVAVGDEHAGIALALDVALEGRERIRGHLAS
jgi:hypothetical protein